MPTIHSKSDPSSGSGIFVKYPKITGFTVVDHLHEGSHSSIYKARQDRLGRMLALKLVPEWPPPTDVALERFNRAAYVCAHTPHPGLATLFDVGTRDGYYFATYTLLEGQTLQRHLGMVNQVDEGFATHVGLLVARTLAALHGNNICHRNVKPKNLFLESTGNVRMIGLGLASCKSAFFSPHLDTHAIGTPHFMAPEMIKGSCADPRSDLYSLGVTLYVMVAGRPPYDRGIPAVVMSRHLTDTPASLKEIRPDLSAKFVNLVEALMVKDPAKRVASAAEAAGMFEALSKKNSSFWRIAPLAVQKPTTPTPFVPVGPAAAQIAGAAPSPVAEPAPAVSAEPMAAVKPARHMNPIVVAGAAATSAVLLVLGVMYAAQVYYGKTPTLHPHAQPEKALPDLPEAVPTVQADPTMERDFNHLLEQSTVFEEDPAAGCKAWCEFLIKHPTVSQDSRTIAEQRLQIYQTLKARNALDVHPRQAEPEF